MKRYNILLFFCLLCTAPLRAQYTGLYSSPDAKYAEGVELYMQGHYAASARVLGEYKGHTYREQTSFYLAADAFELRRKDAQKSLQAYLKQNTYTPYASEVHFMLGVLQTERGKNKQAVKEFEQVNEKDLFRPHQADYLFHRGYAHLKLNEPQRAAGCFARLKGMKSRYTLQARYYYAFTQYTLQNYGKALPEFFAIEHTEAYKDIVPYYIIQIYYSEGQFDEVYERAEYLLSNNPDNPNNAELHRMLGEIYYREGEYDKTIAHLSTYEQDQSRQKLELVRNDMYLLGMAYYQTGEMPGAIRYLTKVRKDNDVLSQNTCYHLGNAYVRSGQTEQAKMAYSAAMRYRFDERLREEAMYNYALTTYRSSTALGESVTAFTDFLEQYPESKYKETVYNLLCEAFMNSKNYASALEALQRIGRPDKKTEETKQYLRYQLGCDAYMQGKSDKAVEWFSQVIDSVPPSQQTSAAVQQYVAESRFLRAESEYRLGQYDKAKADLEAFAALPAAAKSPNRVQADYSAGYVCFAQKNYKGALDYFLKYTRQATEQEASYSDALNRIGDCYFNDRDFVKAEAYYAKVIALGGAGADYATFQRGYALGLLKRYGDKINTLEKLVKNFPKSDYADDALYEIARAELQRDNDGGAIDAYERLLKSYPHSGMARKAALEKGMIYYNRKDYTHAIEAYKAVIKNYPGSEEAYSALDGLEAAYVETDNVSEYLAYTKSLGRINMKTDSREDSLTYVAAERQYMLGNHTQAVAGLSKYLSQYCPGGRYCTMAQYYVADSYYRLGKKPEAKAEFVKLAGIAGNPYMEEALMRVAEISYDEQDYTTALQYFKRLQVLAGTMEKMNIARLGVLRCSYELGDHAGTVNVASQIIEDTGSSPAVIAEARYNRAKALFALKDYDAAIGDLQHTSAEVRTAQGAEAKYLLAQSWFELSELDKAEVEVMSFAGMNTQHQYWLARSFVLLSDIYVRRGDDFQAKQYLLSLQSNYRVEDDIHTTVRQRLQQIDERENEKLKNEEDDDED